MSLCIRVASNLGEALYLLTVYQPVALAFLEGTKKRAKLCIVARSEAKLTQAHAKLDIIIRVCL